MTLKDDKSNWRIEKIGNYFMPVCRSPYGSRMLKKASNLKSETEREAYLMMQGMFRVMDNQTK